MKGYSIMAIIVFISFHACFYYVLLFNLTIAIQKATTATHLIIVHAVLKYFNQALPHF